MAFDRLYVETITPERLDELVNTLGRYEALSTGEDLPYPKTELLASSKTCASEYCTNRMSKGYLVERVGYVCYECATLRLIRGLVEKVIELEANHQSWTEETVMPRPGSEQVGSESAGHGTSSSRGTSSLGPALDEFLQMNRESQSRSRLNREPVTVEILPMTDESIDVVVSGKVAAVHTEECIEVGREHVDAALDRRGVMDHPADYSSESTYVANAKAFDKTGADTVLMTKGGKINPMDLPPGTILTFEKHVPVVHKGDVGHPDAPHESNALVNRSRYSRNYDEEGNLRGISFIAPEIDLDTLPPADRPFFAGYKPGRMTFTGVADVYAYERQYGVPSIMAAQEDGEDGEFDPAIEAHTSTSKIARANDRASLRTQYSDEEKAERKALTDEVGTGTQQAFPTLTLRPH